MLRTEVTAAALNARGAGRLPELFGFRVTTLEANHLAAEMTIEPRHLATNGFLHAASVIALADTACGYGCLAHLPRDADSFTTIELKSNFLGTAREGIVACVARPAHLGRTTQVWDATVTRRSDGRVIALFRCTQMIFSARAPA